MQRAGMMHQFRRIQRHARIQVRTLPELQQMRVRQSQVIGTRAGVIKGLTVTGGVITSAGIVLAATFGVLGVLPLVFLAELGFAVAFGVLLDTIVVRSLLVPALVREIGPKIWWPSKLQHQEN